MVKVPSSLGDFIATKQNKSMRCNKEQKLGCHFKVTSALPARLDLQRVSLLFFYLGILLRAIHFGKSTHQTCKGKENSPCSRGRDAGGKHAFVFS